METRKSFEELNLLDDFLMAAVASNQKVGASVCRLILSTLLEREIGEVEVVAQRMIPALAPALRGIRLDVEIVEKLTKEGKEENTKEKLQPICRVYDLEPHTRNNLNLPRHNRFYQARIDSRYLEHGERDFGKLPELYVLTITPYDPFGEDYMVYTVRNQYKELPNLPYDDGLQYFYFYTKGTKGGSPAIKSMLEYIQNSQKEQAVSEELKELHRYVSEVKMLPEVREQYMHLEDYIDYRVKEITEEVVKGTVIKVAKETTHEMRIQVIIELLEDLGEIPKDLINYLHEEQDEQTLRKWHKLAAKAETMESFMESCGFVNM